MTIQRFRTWWIDRRTRRRWHAMGPDAQLAAMIQVLVTTLDRSPDLRKAMRKALRVRGDSGMAT